MTHSTRMRIRLAALILSVAAGVAAAQEVLPMSHAKALAGLADPSVQVRQAAVERLGEIGTGTDADALLPMLHDDDQDTRDRAQDALQKVWDRPSDPLVEKIYRQGIAQMKAHQLPMAVGTFTRIIERKPAFTEAWNKRATAYFLMGDLKRSQKDCDEVLKRNPNHYGALAGYGQILLHRGQPERSLTYFRRALAINPNLDGVAATLEKLQEMTGDPRAGTI